MADPRFELLDDYTYYADRFVFKLAGGGIDSFDQMILARGWCDEHLEDKGRWFVDCVGCRVIMDRDAEKEAALFRLRWC